MIDPLPDCVADILNLSRLYRAHVSPRDSRGTERTAFVEAFSHQAACRKIAVIVAAIEHRQPAEVADRLYNCCSAKDLIEVGVSEDIETRLFETGWSGGKATHFVSEPLFLVDRPAALCRKWAAIVQRPDDAGLRNCSAAVPDAPADLPHCKVIAALTSRENY